MKTKLIGHNEATISNIFLNRGINPNDILSLNEKNLIDPDMMINLNEACEVVYGTIKNTKGIIGIVQDPDADGYMSSAIIFNYLSECFPLEKNRFKMLIHEDKAHGIPVEQLDSSFSMVIAPDCSSNEHEVHKRIVEEFNIPIVILDHHDAIGYSPYATMVNISLDSYPAHYPNGKLAGGGVCLKFAQLFDKKYGFNFFRNYYDMAAIANLADMVEINTLETIYISQMGMRNIHNTFLKTLYEAKAFNIGDQVTPMGISFYIAPLINALTRVGTLEEKQEFVKAITTQEREEIRSTKRGAKSGDTETLQAAVVRKMNNIKARQDRIRDKAFNELESKVKEEGMEKNQILILDTENKFPKTFTGLIANQFVGRYKKPTLVGSCYEKDGKTFFGGSARGDDKSDLSEMKQFENNSGLFEFAEGHEAAHGFAFELDKKKEIINYFNTKLEGIVFEPVYRTDFELDWGQLNKQNLDEITRYSTYWARGLEEPIFKLKNVPVNKETLEIGGSFGDHKVTFSVGPIRFIKFKGVKTDVAQKLMANVQSKVDIVGTVKKTTYKGETFLQIFVSELEIQSSKKYIF